jgi:hypothetical protein
MGLLSFVGALGLRAWATFPGHLGNGLAMLMLSAILLMNQIFNYTVDNLYPCRGPDPRRAARSSDPVV